MENSGLSQFSTEELAHELRLRNELAAGTMLSPELYRLFSELGVTACVDGVALRTNARAGGTIEAMAIRRNSGPFKGKLCSVGGRILLEEHFADALRRHFKTDIGAEIEFLSPWDRPAFVHQFMRPNSDGTLPPDFGPQPDRRHAISIIYAVRILDERFTFGATESGGQEASGVEWFSLEDMPPASEFGYGQDVYYRKCLRAAAEYTKGI